MSAIGFGGTRSHRTPAQQATPEDAASQVVASMEFMAPQEAYDIWISVNPGVGREFLKQVRSQLSARGIAVEA